MGSNEEKENDKEERTVVRPDPLDAAESDTGKAVIEKPGVVGISNVDMKNAIHIAYLDLIKDRARGIGEEVQAEIRQYAQPENDQINVSPDSVSVQMIEMHTLTLTYFEGVAFQFLQWAMEVDHELESHIRDHTPREFPTEGTPRDWDEEVREDFHRGITVLSYIKGLNDAGFLKNDDPIHCVKDRRNDYVHNPEKALHLRTSTDSYPGSTIFGQENRPEPLQEENLDEVVSDVLLDCLATLDEVEEMIEKHLPMNDTIYEVIYKE